MGGLVDQVDRLPETEANLLDDLDSVPDDAPQQPQQESDFYPGFSATAFNAATLGMHDEASGIGAALGAGSRRFFETGSLSDAIDRGKQRYIERATEEREKVKGFYRDYPAVAYPTGIVAGFGGSGPAAAGIPLARQYGAVGQQFGQHTGRIFGAQSATLPKAAGTFWSNVGKQAATAGGISGLYGFASGEGFGNRANTALITGLTGLTLGAALPVGIRGSVGVYSRVKNVLGMGDAPEQAARTIIRALTKDGMSVDDAMLALREWKAAGAKPAALFDIGGQNTRRLARAAAGTADSTAGQKAVEFVTGRKASQADRLASGLAKYMDASDFFTLYDDVIARQQEAAGPLYKQAYAFGAAWDDGFEDLIQRPAIRSALVKAGKAMSNDPSYKGAARNVSFVKDKKTNVWSLADDSDLPDVQMWDYAKRNGLDDAISTAQRGGATNEARILTNLKREMTDLVDDYTKLPDGTSAYKQAREVFSGDAEFLDAMRLGSKVFSGDEFKFTTETGRKVSNMSPSEREAYRVGVVQAIRERVSKTPDGADAVKKFFRTPQQRLRIATAFDDPKQFAQFEDDVMREAQMYEHGQFVSPNTGSQTQLRASEGTAMDDAVVDIGLDMATTGSPEMAVARAAGRPLARAAAPSVAFPGKVADAVADKMFVGDYAANKAMLGGLKGTEAEMLARTLRGAAGYKMGTYAPGLLTVPTARTGGLID